MIGEGLLARETESLRTPPSSHSKGESSRRYMRTCNKCTHTGEDKDFTVRGNVCKKCDARRVKHREDAYRTAWREVYPPVCDVCGYNRCAAAIEYHHRDPSTKRYLISALMKKIHPDSVKAELVHKEIVKCDTLCANCHREVHHSETLRGSIR